MFMMLALVAAANPTPADLQVSRMAALYDEVCLKAFPDDKAVEAVLAGLHAKELGPDAVKVTMHDDPARGWQLLDGSATVWLEFPPYHACSVRWNAAGFGNLGSYRTIADKYEEAVGDFRKMPPAEADQGDIHIHATREQRTLADQSTETLFAIDQHTNDPKRRVSGETGVSVRFVHQFAPPPSDAPKASVPAAETHTSLEDRERFVSIARKLEDAPLSPSLKSDREWALQWLTDAPDVSVTVCGDMLGDLLQSHYPYAGEIIVQYSFSMAGWIIEHPGAAEDSNPIQLAGVEGALSAYRAILREKPQAKSPSMEGLVQTKARGELPNFVRHAADSCSSRASDTTVK